MVKSQMAKWVVGLAPVSLGGAATAIVIDTLGFDYAECIVVHGLVGAADYTVLKVQEADAKTNDTTLTSGADVTGLVCGTSDTIAGATSTFPGDSDDGTIEVIQIDLKARKRYLQLQATAGAASLACVVWRLSRAEQSPETAAAMGAREVLRA